MRLSQLDAELARILNAPPKLAANCADCQHGETDVDGETGAWDIDCYFIDDRQNYQNDQDFYTLLLNYCCPTNRCQANGARAAAIAPICPHYEPDKP